MILWNDSVFFFTNNYSKDLFIFQSTVLGWIERTTLVTCVFGCKEKTEEVTLGQLREVKWSCI